MKRIAVRVNHLSKVYSSAEHSVIALDNVSLDVKDGEFVAIMGASGSGKSTLLNILGCLDSPSSGDYLLDEELVSSLNDDQLSEVRNRKIGFVFQSFNLLPRLSAIKNVELPLIYANVLTEERQTKSSHALEIVGLAERMHHKPSQLSGGQQQRVAIARAIVTNPKIILADEPTGNLDSYSTEQIMSFFQHLNDEGRTIIMVTHENDVAQYCKRVVVFKDGKIISDDKVHNRMIAKHD